MRKGIMIIAAAAATILAGCSRNEVLNRNEVKKTNETPIEFNVQKQNITKATNLEAVNHYNFGVWAWKVNGKNGLADAEVMNNYLVGYSNGTNKGYDKSNATTWKETTSSTSDHESPWFYEKLGTAEYTYDGTAGFYKKTDADYMSNNANQYLRYWDLAYAKTNFYAYAPYNKEVTFTKDATTSTMTFGANVIRDGYDEPLNSTYANYSRTLGEFMYAGVQATNSELKDVTIPFKHMGAQLFIRFYEDIPGYKVEIIELNGDNGKIKDGVNGDIIKGIQATPSIKETSTYSNGTYYTTQGAEVKFTETDASAVYTAKWESSTTATNTTPLMFKIPSTTDLSTKTVAPANLTEFAATTGNTTSHNVIQEVSTSGTQVYSYSPTIYYPVAQPTTSTTGFTFHISYRVIAEDNGEQITIHNATVHVPYKGNASATDGGAATADQWITVWQPNVKYTYTFKFTKNSTGTTNPETAIDPTDPTPSNQKSLYPIVFDAATIEDFSTNYSEYTVSEGTNY